MSKDFNLMLEMTFQDKMNIFRMFYFKSLAYGALILSINTLASIKSLYHCYICYK